MISKRSLGLATPCLLVACWGAPGVSPGASPDASEPEESPPSDWTHPPNPLWADEGGEVRIEHLINATGDAGTRGLAFLYANPGYSVRINELPEKESDEMLAFLFEHQTKPEYQYVYSWTPGDLVMWEDFGTIHNALPDYGPHEHRLIKRCQVMADRFCPAEERKSGSDSN